MDADCIRHVLYNLQHQCPRAMSLGACRSFVTASNVLCRKELFSCIGVPGRIDLAPYDVDSFLSVLIIGSQSSFPCVWKVLIHDVFSSLFPSLSSFFRVCFDARIAAPFRSASPSRSFGTLLSFNYLVSPFKLNYVIYHFYAIVNEWR